jgi:hypothetical protein
MVVESDPYFRWLPSERSGPVTLKHYQTWKGGLKQQTTSSWLSPHSCENPRPEHMLLKLLDPFGDISDKRHGAARPGGTPTGKFSSVAQ